MKIIFIIFFSFLLSTSTFSQSYNFNVGGGIGIGSIKGNLPSQTSFSGKAFIELEPFIIPLNSIQFAFTFAQKLEKIIPENRNNKYYPFIKSLSLIGKSEQFVTENLFIEEGFGLLLLNDRTYDDINTWNYGFVLNASGGTYLNRKTKISIACDYGLTLNNTNASYFFIMTEINYQL